MAGKTPNFDRLASEGHALYGLLRRGKLHCVTSAPHHCGVTNPHCVDDRETNPVAFRVGYATGKLGKNHLDDRNQFMATAHGFDEIFGYLYYLDAMEDLCHPHYPLNLLASVGPAV